MYRKDLEVWLKHVDFIVLDMICLQLAFLLAYALRRIGVNLYSDILSRSGRLSGDFYGRHHEKCAETRSL